MTQSKEEIPAKLSPGNQLTVTKTRQRVFLFGLAVYRFEMELNDIRLHRRQEDPQLHVTALSKRQLGFCGVYFILLCVYYFPFTSREELLGHAVKRSLKHTALCSQISQLDTLRHDDVLH